VTTSFTLSSHLSDAVFNILRQVTLDQCALDKAYAQHFFKYAYSNEEHAEITQMTGALMRKLNLYAFLVDTAIPEITTRFEPLLFAWCWVNDQRVPEFLDLNETEIRSIKQRWEKAQENAALLEGCPDWLEKLGSSELGEQWPKERAALALAAKRYIRTNTLKISPAELAAELMREAIETRPVEGVSGALEVRSNSAIFKSKAFQNGLFEQQDAGSQLIAHALEVKPGMRVIDACAGAGGKTLALAALMKGKGRLLALDVEEHKLDVLKQRARRAAADNVETRLITSNKIIKRQSEGADRLLLDVPCSGIGVLKRNPDAKWHSDLSLELPSLLLLQQDLLSRYSKMLRLNGLMVYATCSILPIENQCQVSKFLENHPQFKLIEQAVISPAATGYDGFYWAKLQRIS